MRRDLAELGLQLGIDFIEGTAESCELLASLIGDDELGHAFPINGLSDLEGSIGNLLPCSTHLRKQRNRRNFCVLGFGVSSLQAKGKMLGEW